MKIERSCTEVHSELYVVLDEEYISPNEFKDVCEQAGRTRAAVRGFINYLKKHQKRKVGNREPDNLSSYKFSSNSHWPAEGLKSVGRN